MGPTWSDRPTLERLGYSQAYQPLLIQTARWGGVYAVGFSDRHGQRRNRCCCVAEERTGDDCCGSRDRIGRQC